MRAPGRLTLRTVIDVRDMLRPAIQPGSKIDYAWPPERVTLSFASNVPIELRADGKPVAGTRVALAEGRTEPLALEIVMPTGAARPDLSVTFTTAEDERERPLPLRRFLLPWAKQADDSEELLTTAPPPELKGGDWLRGRQVFFGNEAGCAKCHTVRGQGSDLGPDLSNLIHRDYESVMRDIRDPSGALNPDYVASSVKLTDGRVLHGIVRNRGEEKFIVRGDADGERAPIGRDKIKLAKASPISVMPSGIIEGLGEAKTRDLLTFLLTTPIEPAPVERKGAPPPRP